MQADAFSGVQVNYSSKQIAAGQQNDTKLALKT
jgi:hypothetical protein